MQSQYTLDVPQALQEEISAFLYRMSVAYSRMQIVPLKAIIQLQVLPVLDIGGTRRREWVRVTPALRRWKRVAMWRLT